MRATLTVGLFVNVSGSRQQASGALKSKDRLKINATICGLESTPAAGAAEQSTNRVRLVKQGRADNAHTWPQVHVIKEIAGVDAEREVKTPVAGGSTTKESTTPATSAQSAAAQATWAAASAASPTPSAKTTH